MESNFYIYFQLRDQDEKRRKTEDARREAEDKRKLADMKKVTDSYDKRLAELQRQNTV